MLTARCLLTLTCLLTFPHIAFAQGSPTDAPVLVMVVADFHMSNPGRDMHNVAVPDVLLPDRQAEIAKVTNALASFHPTKAARRFGWGTTTTI